MNGTYPFHLSGTWASTCHNRQTILSHELNQTMVDPMHVKSTLGPFLGKETVVVYLIANLSVFALINLMMYNFFNKK